MDVLEMDDEFVLNIDDGVADEPPPAPMRVSKGTTRNGAAASSSSSSSSKAHHEQPAPIRTLTRPAKAVAAATKETVAPSPLPSPPRSSRPAAPLPAAAPARDRDRDRDRDRARAPDAPLQPAPAPAPASAPAARQRRRLLPEEDPMQFHARPKELSRNALKRARGDDNDEGSGGDPVPSSAAAPVAKVKRPLPAVTTSHIFTRIAFSDLPLDPRLAAHLQKSAADGGMGLPTSTRVQSVVVPLLTTPQNVLMKSQTGSGKTLAYLLPVINDLMTRSPAVQRHDGTRALLLAPTRELCSQIADVLAKLTQCCVSVVGGSVTGGEKKKSEKARLRKGVVVLVATPGRLLDHLRTTESFTLTRLRWVVLDEVDRLLDMGFEQTILEILSIIRGARLPGLKDSKDIGGGGGGGGGSLQQRYSQQNAQRAKQCRSGDELYHLMASATLTQAVRQLAVPVMGGSGESGGVGAGRFVVVDADREAVDYVESAQDLERIAKAKTKVKSDAESAVAAAVAAADDGAANNKRSAADDATAAEEDGGRSAKMRRTLEKGEAMDAPQQLAQYYMMVTCKWRLAALLCFLKTHSHQKVMVFFSTCDSVDFHALLFRGTEWPEGLDALPDDAASSGSGGDKSGGNSSKSGGNGESNNTTFSVEGFEGMQFRGNSDGVVGKTKPSAVKTSAAAAPGARPRLTNRSMGPSSVEPLPPRFTGMFGAACPMYRLHGNVPQHARQTVYKDFCEAKSGVLLCTDVAARGLDLPEVDWILQYDPPCETTDYVHRVGRTARRGRMGSALLFLLPSEAPYVQLLHSHNLSPEPLSLQSLFLDAAKHVPGAQKFRNVDEMTAVSLHRRVETVVQLVRPLGGAARQAFGSFVRAYATHSVDTKGIFKVQSLHLGHVAKSFGLKESPKNIRVNDDTIGKIFNGHFSASIHTDKDAKKKARDERFSLGGSKAKKNGGGAGSASASASASASGTGAPPAGVASDRRKMRLAGGKALAPSGKFRKTDGYFKKKQTMRPRAKNGSAEFSA